MANDIIDFTNPDEVGEFLLTEGIPGGIAFKSERRDDSLYISEIDMVLTPVVHQLQDKSAGIAFYMRSDKYDKRLFEYSMGMGGDGDETDNLWKELIGCSSLYSAVDKALEAGSKLEDLRISNMYYNMCEGFVIR